MTDDLETDSAGAQLFERFVDETLAIARRGERSAGTLSFVGGALLVVAVLAGIIASSVGLGIDDLSDGERAAILSSGAGAVVALLVGAAMFFGFATLVRNSSRSLEVQTLDSSLLE